MTTLTLKKHAPQVRGGRPLLDKLDSLEQTISLPPPSPPNNAL